MKNLNVSPEAIKIPEGSTANNVSDIDGSNIFLEMSPEARETKASTQGNNRTKRQPTKMGEAICQ